MNLSIKMATYILLISTFDNTLTIPILQRGNTDDPVKDLTQELEESGLQKLRVRRQDPVVQPDWTADQGFGELFQDLDVKVTYQKLEETEAIRDLIQETVESGTYKVELDENDFKEDDMDPEPESESEVEPRHEAEPEPEPEPKPEPQPIRKPEPKQSKSEVQPAKAKKPFKKWKKSGKIASIGTRSPIFAWVKKIFVFPWRKQ